MIKNFNEFTNAPIYESAYTGTLDATLSEISNFFADEVLTHRELPMRLDEATCGKFLTTALEHCMGYIIEGYLLNTLSQPGVWIDERKGYNIKYIEVSQTNNAYYDADLTIVYKDGSEESIKVEIKAYKNGNKSNITFTNAQINNGMEDVCLIYVDYSLSNNNVKINDILIAEPGTIKINRHGGPTTNMYSVANGNL